MPYYVLPMNKFYTECKKNLRRFPTYREASDYAVKMVEPDCGVSIYNDRRKTYPGAGGPMSPHCEVAIVSRTGRVIPMLPDDEMPT